MVTDENGEIWLTTKEAAQQLGLSTSRLYHIRDKLTYRKGLATKSRLFFRERTLFDDYMSI